MKKLILPVAAGLILFISQAYGRSTTETPAQQAQAAYQQILHELLQQEGYRTDIAPRAAALELSNQFYSNLIHYEEAGTINDLNKQEKLREMIRIVKEKGERPIASEMKKELKKSLKAIELKK